MMGHLTETAISISIAFMLSFTISPFADESPTEQGSDWLILTVDTDGEGGISYRYKSTSLALDRNNTPCIAYMDAFEEDLKYAKWNGTDWDRHTLDNSFSVGPYVSLALDSFDFPHISYHDHGNNSLRYVTWNGSAWNIEIIDNDGGVQNSVAIDSNDNPHISYRDEPNSDLKYARWDGSTWKYETVDSVGIVGSFSSLALDSNDMPHISYFDVDNLDLKYARWDGSVWKNETVDDVGRVGAYSSLALDSNDMPHISYFDYTQGNAKYAKWNGAAWIFKTFFSPHHDGDWTSLALDSEEHPHITYHDEFDDDLIYAEWSGINWLIDIVDTEGDTGYYSSLAVDSYDMPHISYYQRWAGNVKYATKASLKPRPPEVLDAVLSGSGQEDVTLTWALSPDDGAGMRTVIGYQIHKNMSYDYYGLGYGLIATLPNRTSTFVDALAGEGNPNNYFYKVCALNRDNNVSCSDRQAGKFTRPLSQGPNLISIPLRQSNESVEKVLQTVDFDKAWTYYAWDAIDPWKWYMTFKPYKGDLRRIGHRDGVWVNVTQESNLTIAGIVPWATDIQLHAGWNLVGLPSFSPDYAALDVKIDTGTVTRIEGFDELSPPYFLKVLQDGDLLQTGYGYWLWSVADVTWRVHTS